jgi:uncharacterized membrane protein
MLVESIFFVLLAFLILLLLVVGFETVGFRLSEALLIFVGSTLLFFSFDPSILLYVDGSLGIGIFVPLYIAVFQPFLVVGSSNGLAIGVDVAGFLIPFLISLKMIFDRRSPIRASLIGIACIAALTNITSTYVPGEGVLIWNIYVIAIAASVIGIGLAKRQWGNVGPIAYVSGSLGVLLGADLARLGDILSYQPRGFAFASVGGAGVFDAIFLVGVLAVTIDVIFVENVRFINWVQRRWA